MRRASLVVLAATSAAILAAVAGCNAGTDAAFGYAGAASTAPGAAPAGASTCAAPSAREKLADPSSLPACAPACGGAHCVPEAKVPAGSRASFASCGGGYCLPDTLIQSGGAKPAACASLNGAAGVCLSTCVPQVAENADVLPQASCAAGERCAPCVNPNDGTVTGACAIGEADTCAPDGGVGGDGAAPAPDLTCPHVGAPVLDPGTLPACGGAASGAHCLPAHLTPADLTAKLASCTGGFCVPDKLIAAGGRFIPATCTSIGGAEGRCQSAALPSVAAQTLLPVASCDATERCVPCSSPVDGTETGACKTSCDPGPKSPPVTFPGCCGMSAGLVGKCVPQGSIPASMQSVLEGHGCQNALCVPTENLTAGFTPQACIGDPTFGSKYSGVCLSDCLDFGFASELVLDRGNCPKDHTCAPCQQDGKSTGAPGCPP
ncbi:MAG: Tryptophan synthase alpha chain [Labilithrix sp.]|nr:Tryptophan synthase alpha chain [Labilithrix sp.]